jgi:hypothetical protein
LLRKVEKQRIGQGDVAVPRHNEEQVVDQMLMQSLLHAVKKMELLLMISVAMLVVLCVLLFVMISKIDR